MGGKISSRKHTCLPHDLLSLLLLSAVPYGSGAQGFPGSKCGPDKVEWRSMRCGSAEDALDGQLLRADTLVEALEQLQHDISPASDKGNF